ncbi:MAG: type I glyceraldehyde-3-phosphate dehydrogenase [Alphaproteobacteria bacterium]|nr:type I glyceraldehyde-3-phosphate dehydrogenase [Alphaproteobacteria bacterium]
MRIAINGFGRIGRLVLRAIAERKDPLLQVVAINDLSSIHDNAHLFKYDSIHGRFGQDVKVEEDTMDVGTGPIKVISCANPADLPWQTMNIDLVLECSGRFTSKESAMAHIHAGAKKVLISAPATGVDMTVVYGVNEDKLQDSHQIVSNASCTTNCLAPMAQVLHQGIGIVNGYMTTIHAYTADQRLVDSMHNDLRRARAAALSMIPSSTGAAKAIGLVLPELNGKLEGTAIRVPTSNVSLVDLTFNAARDTSISEINELMSNAAQGRLKGILGVVDEPLVSIDFNHNPLSSSFDLTQTAIIDKRLCRVVSWYDNEWGFSNRMLDTAKVMCR